MRRLTRRQVLGGLGGAALAGALPLAVAAQTPPRLSSEELLRLVLPAAPDGSRPGVLAWARIDDTAARDGAPRVFVALIYTTPGPFEQYEVRRLVNRVSWGGLRYTLDHPNEPGEVLAGELIRLGDARASLAIEASSNRSEGNPIYTVTYTASTGGNGADEVFTLTELFRPTGALMWRRVTEQRTVEAVTSEGQEVRRLSVTYRFENAERGALRLVATVSESVQRLPAGVGAAQTLEAGRFIETYVQRGDAFELDTRTRAPGP